MREKWKRWNKFGIIGIIILLLLIPISTAVDVNTYKASESKENSEIRTLKNSSVIIAYITGLCSGRKTEQIGLFRKIELWGDAFSTITISGLEKLPSHINYFVVDTHHVIIHHFIGWFFRTSINYEALWGIAIGTLEWD